MGDSVERLARQGVNSEAQRKRLELVVLLDDGRELGQATDDALLDVMELLDH
jgi:hypothetical protein